MENFLNENYIAPSYLLKYIYLPGLNSCHHQPKINLSTPFSLALIASSRAFFHTAFRAISEAGLRLQCSATEGRRQLPVIIRAKVGISEHSSTVREGMKNAGDDVLFLVRRYVTQNKSIVC